ncbi:MULTISPECIES: SIR2 family protein [Rhizobium]|uniref:SIR2 family protein n=1 Tax=Rhizobium phaseoli TaxID=396 RepID=A0A7X6J2V8_9HYPH|nr:MULTISPECIES: SIR2 family protein [Rhizobium]MDE8761958.1 SIR2 family protein [Rhizobium sp. CBK13]NKF13514.1 hypothetical protein [Rhizobium phaseoli]QPK10930.1 SIR2 family protein [Rhizobium phaseoli]
MSQTIENLIHEITPSRTVLLFGSGSSMPSGAPSVAKLIAAYAQEFKVSADFSLSEITQLAENKSQSRRKVISLLRKYCSDLKPTGGLRNLPLYDWKSIYTTNYDRLIELSYEEREKRAKVFSSNFDFNSDHGQPDVSLFKLHGTIEKDECDGHNSRIILTESDFTKTSNYREQLYDRMKSDLISADLVIIGHSLGDAHLKELAIRAAKLNREAMGTGRVWLLSYTPDEDRASLYEQFGLTVAFGSIDDFFKELAKKAPDRPISNSTPGNPLDVAPALVPVTTEVEHAVTLTANFSSMYTGWPATYADIVAGYTFKRTLATRIGSYLSTEFSLIATILGASGVGKSTAAKQILVECRNKGWKCWEHGSQHALDPRLWEKVATNLKSTKDVGVLFVDDAHLHLGDLNELIDRLAILDNAHLKILLASTRNHWHPRIKTGNLFRHGKVFNLSTLNDQEIDALLDMVEKVPEIKRLAGNDFAGFDRSERRRRLTVRASKDMFVCLKNIYNTDSLDAIILQDFASLSQPLQDIFRYVAAMETAGINVHRQLVIRLLGMPAQQVAAALEGLADIVSEYDYHVREGIFEWRCRHPVIAAIITKFKFGSLDKTIKLFEDVIDNISPTFDIEVRSLRELCNTESGIPRIADKKIQNHLLAKMISRAPGERVPRHRLIRNLIEMHEFPRAETEIKLFEKDFGRDGPVHRYKIKYQVERAIHTPGILLEDRVAMLEQAHELAVVGAERYAANKNVLAAYAELGVEYYRLTKDLSYFDEAMRHLKSAEDKLGDPQITAMIVKFTRRIGGQSSINDEELPEDVMPDADVVEVEPEAA